MAIDFTTLGISKVLTDLLGKNGIKEPTPVQEQTIPLLMSGKDVIAQAQTGTGKTLAFVLPILEKIKIDESFVQTLIVTPTRELSIQVTAEIKKLSKAKGVNILAAYGGQDVEQQVRKLKGAVHIVIGTPGRLLDHLRRKTVDFRKLSMLILDEADQMLDMGFLKDVEQIIDNTPKRRQTMLFSATISKEIKELSLKYMHNPEYIRIKSSNITLDEIKQVVIETTDRGKQDALCKLMDEYKPFLAIVFCRTKRRAITLNEALKSRGYNSDELHGDLSQAKREKAMRAFREAKIQFLVATDVAARGLDVEGVTHVFNYDIPHDAESYVHRIGRTGRAGQRGMAVTFMVPQDREFLHVIERGIKTTLERHKIGIKQENIQIEGVNEARRNIHKNSYTPRYPGKNKGQRTTTGKRRGEAGYSPNYRKGTTGAAKKSGRTDRHTRT